MSQAVTSTLEEFQIPSQPFKELAFSPEYVVILGLLIFVGIINLNKHKKATLARARWGGAKERAAAMKLACQQIEQQGGDKLSLFIGTPSKTKIESGENGQKILYLPPDPKSIYLPNCQENILIVGSSGRGKSRSGIDPLFIANVLQGSTIFYYDFKGHENPSPSDKLVAFAREHGYKVWHLEISATEDAEANEHQKIGGKRLSCVLNLLDFLKGPYDAEGAFQLATSLVRNFGLTESSNGNDFFTKAGIQLLQAVMMLAKRSDHPDLATCHKILSLPNLIGRLKNAKLPQAIKVAFDNFLSTAGAEETAAGIASTASLLLSRFMNPKVLATFAGETTMPLDFDGRHLVIFKMNPQQKAIAAPLIAASIEMLVARNIYRPRVNFLSVFLDEINSILITQLVDWLNQNRSSKFCAILGVQSFGFLESVYGKEAVNGIIGGCGTQIVLGLNDNYTAEYYSTQLGQEEIKIRQNSQNFGSGPGGNSRSVSDQHQTRHLMEIQQFRQMLKGKAIILNGGYTDGNESHLPIVQRIRIPKHDHLALDKSAAAWGETRQKLIKRNQLEAAKRGKKPVDLERFLTDRERLAYILLPSLEDREQKNKIFDYVA